MPRGNAKLLAALAAVVVGASAALVPVAFRLLDGDAAAADLEADLRAQSSAPLTVTRSTDGSTLRSVGTRPGSPIEIGGLDPAGTFLDRYGSLLGTGDTDLVPIGTEPSLTGGTATRYQQTLDGVPVLGGEVSVQVDADGNVLSSLADLSARAPTVDTSPGVGPAAARRAAVTATARATEADPASLTASPPEPWIYDPSVVGPPSAFPARLTWRTEVTSTAVPVRQLVLVDAETGTIALSFSQLAEGLDRKVCDAANTRQAQACTAPYARVEGQARLSPVTNPATANEVDLVYDYSGATYDFFATRFGRDGIANDGAPVVSKVRFCNIDPVGGPASPCPYNNAFWNGQQLTFGQGYARADDVVAHELTHGITEHTANLFYWYQSGAINESMSDVFGELVDLSDGFGNDAGGVRWRVGEDLPGGAIRNMADPTMAPYGDPDRMTSSLYTADSSGNDAGGVHANSGVGNRAAALMTDGGTFNGLTVTSLGITKTAAIYYETLTTLLLSGSDYADLGVALPQACRNLVGGAAGITGADCNQVDAVVAATEMASQPTAGGSAAPTAPEAPVCEAGLEPVDLVPPDDMENQFSGRWSFDTVDVAGVTPDYRWAYESEVGLEYATSGGDGLWGTDDGRTADRRVQMTQAVALPPATPAFLHFNHAYGFESSAGTNWDGGRVEYTTNGGTNWNDLGPLFAGAGSNGYNGALVGGGTNPLAGQSAFVGSSHGFVSSRASLQSLAGQSVRIRFRIGEDADVGTPYGWFIDDLRLYTCEPGVRATITQSAAQTSVVAGQAIDLRLSVHNTGAVPLTNVHVADPAAPGCDTDLASLAPDATQTIDCTHTTVDPGDVGDWVNVATVTATELPPAGITSGPLTVAVIAVAPSVQATLAADETIVTVGDVVHLHTTVHNDGNVTLTGVQVAGAGCTDPIADLAVNASVIVDCGYTTVAPDDLGTWSATTTVTAAQLATPATSNTAEVTVLEPDTPAMTLTQIADEATVNLGDPVTLHLTIENTGNVALAGIALSTPEAPACEDEAVLPELPVGGQETIDCTHIPTVVGTWTSTASVTATRIPDPVAAGSVSVDVLDVTPPDVTLTTPAEGDVYNQGQVVTADFTCFDGEPGAVQCNGDVADGQAVDTSTPGEHTFTVTGMDLAGNVSAPVTHTYTVATRRPDGRIRQGTAGTTVGDDRYNLTGARQTRTTPLARGDEVTYFITVQNDGTEQEAFRVRGQPSTTNYTVRYFTAGVDITLKARNGTYQTPPMGPGAVRTIKAVVTVGAGAPAGSQAERLVTISSANDPLKKDTVRFIVQRS